MKTVAIVDPDLGFLLWLGQLLDSLGHRGIPAQTVRQATSLIERLALRIDLLVIDPTLSGAADFCRKLRARYGDLRLVLVIESMAELNTELRRPDAIRRRPRKGNNLESSEWLLTIEHLLSQPIRPR